MSELEREILEEIRRLAAAELAHEGPVETSQRLHEDLALDSLSTLVVAVGLEDRFRVALAEEDAGELRTVGDLVALVRRRLEERRAETGT